MDRMTDCKRKKVNLSKKLARCIQKKIYFIEGYKNYMENSLKQWPGKKLKTVR